MRKPQAADDVERANEEPFDERCNHAGRRPAADAIAADAHGRVEFASPWPTGPVILYLGRVAR